MKMARIVIIFYALLMVAITVGDKERPVSSAIIRATDCCTPPCPPICPPGATH